MNANIPSSNFHYMANKIKKATIKQKRPIASDKANPRIAYENSCCFSEGFLKETNTFVTVKYLNFNGKC